MTEKQLLMAALAAILVALVLGQCDAPALPWANAGPSTLTLPENDTTSLSTPAPAQVREITLPPGSLYTISDLYGETWITIKCEATP